MKLRVGIIGTGRIADRFVRTALSERDDAVISCVYNPHFHSAERFSLMHGIKNFTDDIELFKENVDAVYIASPHETHYIYAKDMLRSCKHVLCEKPMSLKKAEAEEIFAIAAEKNVVLMEAIKTAYCPGFMAVMDKAVNGAIGEVKDVECCFTRLTPVHLREFQNTEFGGSFMEFGSYVMLPVMKILGTDYKDIHFYSIKADTGVDSYTKAFLEYAGKMGMGKTGLAVKSEGQLLISGTEGYILVPSPWWMTKAFEIRYEDSSRIENYDYPYEGSGLQYEFDIFKRNVEYVASKKTDKVIEDNPFCGVSREESIALAGIFEKFLGQK